MASTLAIAEKRARADLRLSKAAEAASAAFGVPLQRSNVPANRFPALHAAETAEGIAEFLERLVKGQEQK